MVMETKIVKKRFIVFFLQLLICASLFAQQKKAALLPLTSNKAYTQQGKDDAEGIWGALSNQISKKGVLTMVNRSDIDKLLSEKEFQQKSISEKVKDAKRIANADYLIIGRLDELGGYYNLYEDIYDLAGETLASAFVGGIKMNDVNSFNSSAAEIADRLFSVPRPNGRISIKQEKTNVTMEWERASDTETFSRKLEYKVVYSSRKKDLDDPYFAELDAKKGSDWKFNAREASFSVPDADSLYYFTVLVRNPLGAQSMYEVRSSTGASVKNAQTGASISVSEDFIFVEGGTSLMGSTSGDNDEYPMHTVTVDSFYMCAHEVTQAEYSSIMGNNPSRFNGENRPVEMVSWNAAIEYCVRRSLAEGLTPCYKGGSGNYTCDFSANGYRLPTEAEWEYAASGGNKSYLKSTYSGSSDIGSVAWYDGNSGSSTHDVMTKSPNELGLYDMSGNVWEWCWNWYGSYSGSDQTNPTGASSGSNRVLRGGSWGSYASNCRVSNRNCYSPGYTYDYLGFRVVRSSSN